MKLLLIIFCLLSYNLANSQDLCSTKLQILPEKQSLKVQSDAHEVCYFFIAERSFAAIETTGLNNIEITESSPNGQTIPFYFKDVSASNIDFFYEGLKVGKSYYVRLINESFEQNEAMLAIQFYENKVVKNLSVRKQPKPFQNVRIEPVKSKRDNLHK